MFTVKKIKKSLSHIKDELRALPFFLIGRFIKPHFDGKESLFIMIGSFGRGGAQRVASVLASELSDHYHVSAVIRRVEEKVYPLDERVEIIKLPNQGINEKQLRRYLILLKKMRNPVASISFMYDSNRMNTWGNCRCKAICCERNNPAKKMPELFDETVKQYRKADHVIFQSEIVRSLYDEDIRKHSTILPNPVDVTCYASQNQKHRIVTVGRLHPQKNQAMLIRTFASFCKQHPGYTLSIYGEGELEQELKNLVTELGISSKVLFHGNVENIHPEIADAEMFVLSSDYEGLSNALLEAMMMGIPCISTECEGSVDVIDTGRNGILVPVGDEKALLSAMEQLADDEKLRKEIAKEGKKTAEGFRKETVVEKWIEVIEKVIAEE